MATSTFTQAAQVTTDAEFRTWGSAVAAAFAAVGLVQTADTGQINWVTVTKPVAANTVAGYEIWRFNDALQATKPVFIKFEYGSAVNSATGMGMWATVGTAVNGAGTLTGTQIGTRNACGAYSGNVAAGNSYFSGSSNRLAFAINSAVNVNTGGGFAVERNHDAAGGDASDGVSYAGWVGGTSSSTGFDRFVPFAGVVPAQDSALMCLAGPAATSVIGADVGVYPVFPWSGKLLNPRMGLIGYSDSDITRGSTFQVSMYGSNRTFIALGVASATGSSLIRGSFPTSQTVAIRYE